MSSLPNQLWQDSWHAAMSRSTDPASHPTRMPALYTSQGLSGDIRSARFKSSEGTAVATAPTGCEQKPHCAASVWIAGAVPVMDRDYNKWYSTSGADNLAHCCTCSRIYVCRVKQNHSMCIQAKHSRHFFLVVLHQQASELL